MEKDLKDLLLKDLCARLPYKPQVEIIEDGISITSKLTTTTIKYLEYGRWNVKPYLFPLSSMTEEQREELFTVVLNEQVSISDCSFNDMTGYSEILTSYIIYAIDWLLKNHFDWRGLIPMNLAIDATNLNIY